MKILRHIFILTSFLFSLGTLEAQEGEEILKTYSFSWASQIASSKNLMVKDVKVSNGRVILYGQFNEQINVDPYGNFILTSNGSSDIFIATYDQVDGTLLNAVSFGDVGSDQASELGIFDEGIVIGGLYVDNIDFGIGNSFALKGNGGPDGFVAWFDFNLSKTINAIGIGGEGFDVVTSLDVAPTGLVYAGGQFFGLANVGGITLATPSRNDVDAFWAGITPEGNVLFAENLGDDLTQSIRSVDFADNGRLYLAMEFNGEIRNVPNQAASNGGKDVMIITYNPLENKILANFNFGGKSDDFATAVRADGNGNVYVSGYHLGTINFDPKGEVTESAAGQNGYVAVYNENGDYGSHVVMTGEANVEVSDMELGPPEGKVYVAGNFTKTTTFDQGKSVALSSTGAYDAFFAAYSDKFELIDLLKKGGTGSDFGDAIARDDQDIYVLGRFSGAVLIDPGTETSFKSSGITDVFFSRYTVTANSPISQPTNFSTASVTESSFNVTYSAPASTPTGYIALIKSGSPISAIPQDGQSYSVGNTIGDARVIYRGGGTGFNVSGLNPGSNSFIRIFAFNGSGLSTNYLTSSPLSGNQFTKAVNPLNPPTGFSPSLQTSSSYTINFSAAADAPAGYLVLRASGAVPNTVPTDQTVYPLGGTLGNATVVSVGSLTEFSESALNQSTDYFYRIYSYNGGANTVNYRTESVLSGNYYTLSNEPVAQASGLSISNPTQSGFGTISFDAASGAPAGYLVIRRAGAAPTGVPVDGSSYTVGASIGNGTVVSSGSSRSFSDTGLASATTYHYAVFSYNGNGKYSNYFTGAPLVGSRSTLSAEPANQPTNLQFSSITSSSINLSYTAATSSPSGYIILRKAGSAPTGLPSDGTNYTAGEVIGDAVVEYIGTNLSTTSSGLSEGTDYFYQVFSFNGNAGTINYRQLSPLNGSAQTTGSVVAPTTQPTGLSFSSITGSGFSVNFNAASGAPSGYIAIRKVGSAPSGVPSNSVSYTVGQTIGDGEVAFVGSTTSFIEAGLQASTFYHYKIFSSNGSLYNTASPLQGSVLTYAAEPANQPTNFTFTNVTTTGLTLNYLSSGATGYLILRKESAPISAQPQDGVTYSAGETLGDATVVASTNQVIVNDPSLNSGTQYFYSIYAYNGAGGSRNYKNSGPLTGDISLLVNEPTAQPTGLNFSANTSTSFSASFSTASGFPAGYIGIVRLGASPTSVPVDGTNYTPGQTLGDGEVAFVSGSNSFVIDNRLAESDYYLSIYSYNGSGDNVNYLTSSPLQGQTLTLASEPTGVAQNFLVGNLFSYKMDITFSDPASNVPDGYIVLARPSSSPSTAPVDGLEYTSGDMIGSAEVIYIGTATSLTVDSLFDNTTYFYRIYSYNGTAPYINYYTGASLTGSQLTSSETAPTSQASNLLFENVSSTGFTVSFNQTNADGYLVLRKEGSAISAVPTSGTPYEFGQTIGDAVVAKVGSATSFDEIGLNSNSNYFYKVFSFNGESTATKYNTTNPLTGNQTTYAPEPITFPEDLVFSNLSPTSVSAAFTASDATGYVILRNTNGVPAETPMDGTVYAVNDLIGTSEVIFNGTATNFDEFGLTQETNYSYAIYGYLGSGNSINYNTGQALQGTITTFANEPGAPSALSADQILATQVDLSFSTPASAAGYMIVREIVQGGNFTPEDGTAYTQGQVIDANTTIAYIGTTASFSDTGLSQETTYFYSVYAYNGTDLSTNYSPGTAPFQVLTLFEDTTPPVITNNTDPSVTAGSSVPISVNVIEQQAPKSIVTSVEIEYRPIGNGSAWSTPIPMTDDGSNNYSYSIPSNSLGDLGVEYRITAENENQLSITSDVFGVKLIQTAPSFSYNNAGKEVGNYSIIAVPFSLSNRSVSNVFKDLGSYDPKKWRLYHYSNNRLNELSGSGNIELGKGYWFIAAENATINVGEGETATVNSADPYTFNLSNGWNQIGNPYPFAISWDKIRIQNGNPTAVRQFSTYSGGYSSATKLDPYEGAFVFSEGSNVIEVVPDKSTIGGRLSKNPHWRLPISNEYWEVPLTLSDGSMKNAIGGFGMSPEAEVDFDQLDRFNLPRFIEYLEVNFEGNYKGFPIASQIVPTRTDYTWNFVVNSSSEGKLISIEWDNSYFGNSEEQLILWDNTTGKAVDMRKADRYQFFYEGETSFTVLYGSRNFVESKLIPQEPQVLGIYPNPFFHETNIELGIPGDSGTEYEVLVEVYDMLGKRSAVLYNKSTKAGILALKWNGESDSGYKLPAGNYIIRMTTQAQSAYQKIQIRN